MFKPWKGCMEQDFVKKLSDPLWKLEQNIFPINLSQLAV